MDAVNGKRDLELTGVMVFKRRNREGKEKEKERRLERARGVRKNRSWRANLKYKLASSDAKNI